LQAVAEEQDGNRQKQCAQGADGLGHEQSPAARASAGIMSESGDFRTAVGCRSADRRTIYRA
jgi:hypothetical protein